MVKNQKFYIHPRTEIGFKHFNKSYVQKIKTAQSKLQPELQSSNNCVIILTVILTEPDWITVPCDDSFSNLIICQRVLNNTSKGGGMANNSSLKTIWCEEGHLFIENKCILFKQHKKLTDLEIFMNEEKVTQSLTNVNFYQSGNGSYNAYFSLIQHHFIQPLQFTLPDLSHKTVNTYTRVESSTYGEHQWIGKITNETITHYDGYLLFPYSHSQIKLPPSLFHCNDGSYIHETLICNGIEDCSDGTDEKNCTCSNSLQSFGPICKLKCKGKKCTCSDFFFKCSSFLKCIPYSFVCDGYRDCQEGEDEICNRNGNESKDVFQFTSNNETFKCSFSGISIDSSLVNDLIPNCPGSFEDEMEYYNLLTVPYQHFNTCNNNFELPCVPGHSYCFPLSKICIFDLHHNSQQLKYCRNGAHLYNCTHFECPGYFKCSVSYCVPFDLVCK